MEHLTSALTVLLGFAVLALPPAVALTRTDVLPGIGVSLVLTAIMIVLFYWWRDTAVDVNLWWLGVDPEGWTMEARTRNVRSEMKDHAEALYGSRMGVGWPLSAIMAITLLLLPYTCLSFLGVRLGRRVLHR